MKIENTADLYHLYADNGSHLYRSKSLYKVACVHLFLAQKHPMTVQEKQTATDAMREYDAELEAREQARREKKKDANAKRRERRAAERAAAVQAAAEDITNMDLTIQDPLEKKGATDNE